MGAIGGRGACGCCCPAGTWRPGRCLSWRPSRLAPQSGTWGEPFGCFKLPFLLRFLTMRRLGLLTVLAIILTLPGYGLAGLAQRSCQEEMQAADQIVQAGDCCPGKGGQNSPCKQDENGAPGKNNPCSACKVGHNCKSPQSYEPTHTVVVVLVSDRPTLSADPPTLIHARGPAGLWRPPRLI
jgi:hypothetical protein